MKKRKYGIVFVLIILIFWGINWFGIGYYSSGSAILDLKEELEHLHGEPYIGREVENGIENMEFSVEPKTFFLTNYNLRKAFGLDYQYRCEVKYTVYSNGKMIHEKKFQYIGIDPMGQGKEDIRAYIDTEK